jgi:hypothetical protein
LHDTLIKLSDRFQSLAVNEISHHFRPSRTLRDMEAYHKFHVGLLVAFDEEANHSLRDELQACIDAHLS